MVRPPRDISEDPSARRALFVDVFAALAVAVLVIALSAGLGVVAIIAIPTLLVSLAWVGVERGVRRARGTWR
jgi:hypothetical protein